MPDPSRRIRSSDQPDVLPTQDIRAALGALSGDDLLRLRTLARMRARTLPNTISWSDLLHEAVLRVLSGARPWPPDVPLLTFMGGVMRSLCDEHWRRLRSQGSPSTVDADDGHEDPEQAYAARQALVTIYRMFAADMLAMKVITGLTEGLTASEIRRHYELTETEYDTTRRRMRRTMLRHGLGWSRP